MTVVVFSAIQKKKRYQEFNGYKYSHLGFNKALEIAQNNLQNKINFFFSLRSMAIALSKT